MAGTFVIILIIFSIQNRTNGKVSSGGKIRRYLLYVPDSYDPDSPSPLVISLHGFVQWPAHQKILSGWNELADETGFLVVYPKGRGFPLRWNTRSGGKDPSTENRDLNFISDLIDHLGSSYNIDPARIYVNGMSNGGGMSEYLACELSDRIAAFGGVAGAYLYPMENCSPDRPVPVIAFHGVDDQIVHYTGGPSRDDRFELLHVEDWARNWADHNFCGKPLEITQINSLINRISYSGCEEGAEVILYRIEGAGHTWPGGDEIPVFIAGYTNQDINASDLMWDFFSKYSLRPD